MSKSLASILNEKKKFLRAFNNFSQPIEGEEVFEQQFVRWDRTKPEILGCNCLNPEERTDQKDSWRNLFYSESNCSLWDY